MTEEIENLYNLIRDPETSDEDRYRASAALLELYQNPSTVLVLFAIINNKDSGLRQDAAVGLKKCFQSFWEKDIDSGIKEDVKAQILNSLSEESDLLIAKNIIEASEDVFETEAMDWDDLFTFIGNNLQTILGIQITMYLVANAARFFKEGLIDENYQLFQEIAQQGINSQNPETMVLACEMLGVLISFVSPQNINLWEEQQTFLINFFLQYLSIPPENFDQECVDFIRRIILSIEDSFQSDQSPIEPLTILQQLLQVLEDQCPKERYAYIFMVIQGLIKYKADELVEEAESLLKATIIYGAEVYNDDDFDSVTDMEYIASIAGDFAGELKMPRFIKLVQSLAPTEGAEELSVSYACVLYHSIDECKEEVANDLKPIVETVIAFLNSEIFLIKEIGTQIAVIIGDNLEYSQLDIADTLLQDLISLIALGNYPFTQGSFCAIISLLSQGLARSEIIPHMLEVLLGVLNSEEMSDYHALSIEAISSLIFAVEEDILPYSNQILPIIIEGVKLQPGDPNLDNIRKLAIIALGNLLRFGSQSIQDQIQEAVEIILSNVDFDDVEMYHSVLLAIGNLVIAHLDILVNYRDQIIQIIDGNAPNLFNFILKNDESNDNNQTVALEYNYTIQGFVDMFSIMKWIFKEYNELAPDSPTQWMATIFQIMCAPYPELQKRSIVAGFYGTAMISHQHPDINHPHDYFELLVKLLQSSDDSSVVGKCFSAFRHLIKAEIAFDQTYLEAAVNAAFASFEGNLECQKKVKSLEIYSSRNLFKFLKALFRADQTNFPVLQYISSFKKLANDERQLYEVSHYIKVLNYIYSQVHSQLENVPKKKLIQYLLKSFERFASIFSEEEDIDYSTFSVPPAPLESMYLLLQFDPNSIQEIYPNILEFIGLILNSEFNGEQFYYATVSHAIEFLCHDFQINTESFDFGNWFPLILQRLPLKLMSDEYLSEHIYNVILLTMSNPEVIQNYGENILNIFIQTFGVKEKLFSRYHFTEQTIANIIISLKQMMPELEQNLKSAQRFFGEDEVSYLRFCERLGQFA